MKVPIKKLHPDAEIPKYQTLGSAGFDLVALEDTDLRPGQTKIIKTGIAIEVPIYYELQVRPRSGTSLKSPLRVSNSPGTVDSDYRGECCVIMTYLPNLEFDATKCGFEVNTHGTILIKKGDRIAQGVLSRVEQAEFKEITELSETLRGTGGFGSTGK